MSRGLYLAMFLWLFLSSAVILVAYNQTTDAATSVTDWKAFSLSAGVGLTFLTSFFGAVLSVQTQLRQREASEAIELLKYRVSALRQATDAIYLAASNYYHTIAQMETGKLDQREIHDCEQKSREVTGYLKDVTEDVKDAWYEFWTRARKVSEDAVEDGVEPKAVWQAEVKNIGAALKELETRIRNAQEGRA